MSADLRIDRVDQCKVVWYQWTYELPTNDKSAFKFKPPGISVEAEISDSSLGHSRGYDISSHIENLTFSKSLQEAAGIFSFTLYNSFDWVRFIKAGQWVCIYLSGDGDLPLPIEGASTRQIDTTKFETFDATALPSLGGSKEVSELPLPEAPDVSGLGKRRRCVGIIQRVAVRSSTNADGAVETSYVVSGKDFGGVYEDTELWFNMHSSEENTFNSTLASQLSANDRRIHRILDSVHDIFLNTSAFFQNPNPLITSGIYSLRQWIMPSSMVRDLDLSGATYFGDIDDLTTFCPTLFENPTFDFLNGISGKCWDKMKGFSQPEFHELFTELTDDGKPELILRLIPWGLDTTSYPGLSDYMYSYKELAADPPSIPALANVPGLPASKDLFTADNRINSRLDHRVLLKAAQVESFDVGPDQHSRANLFLVDYMRSGLDQGNAFVLCANSGEPFPFKDNNDIRRHGLKPLFVNLSCYNLMNDTKDKKGAIQSNLNDANKGFILECNHMIKDFYANAEDMYSGTINLAAGTNDVKLGKCVITDSTFNGIADMVFYLEGYVDTFNVNADGACVWSQTLTVTRGIPKEVLTGETTKKGRAAQSSTFHAFNKTIAPKSPES